MSLNKFTNTQIGKDLGLKLGGTELDIKDSVVLRGSVFPSNVTTAGYKLENVDGLGSLAWTVDSGPVGDVSFTGTPPVVIGEIPVYNSVDGQAVKESGVLLSTVTTDISDLQTDKVDKAGDSMTGDLNMTSNNIDSVNNLTASGIVTLKGNVIPTNITTAGYILNNTDGVGTLAWTPLDSGVYTPVAVVSAGTLLTIDDAVFTRINNIVHFSSVALITLPTSGNSFNLTVSLPPSTSNSLDLNYSAIASGIDTVAGRPSIVNNISTMTATDLIITLKKSDGADYIAGTQSVNLNFTCQFQIN